MTEARKERSAAFWPLVWTGLITLLAIGCLCFLWSKYRPDYGAASADALQIEELKRQKADLEKLLAMPPCEAKARIGSAMAMPPAAPAAKSQPAAAGGVSAKNVTEPPASAHAAHSEKLKVIESACVFIVSAAGANGLNTGSGFFVAPGYALTNRHVVEGSNNKIFVTNKSLGRPARARIVAQGEDENADYALLKVDLPASARPAILTFAPDAQKTERIGAWGFPHLVNRADPSYARLLRGEDMSAAPELSYSEGVVSAVLDRKPRIIVHTAPISSGNSGGPLINETGKVVGINTMISLDEESYRQASLALAASDILNFLARNGIMLP